MQHVSEALHREGFSLSDRHEKTLEVLDVVFPHVPQEVLVDDFVTELGIVEGEQFELL